MGMRIPKGFSDRFYSMIETLFEEIDQESIREEVRKLREAYPRESRKRLARRLSRKAAFRVAAIGAAAGAAGGAFALLALGPDIFALVREQSRLILAIAFLYGREPRLPERFREVLAVLAVSTGATAAREGASYLLAKGLEEELPKKLIRKIAGKFVARSLPEIAPVIGSVVGAAINALAVKGVEKAAVAYYSRALIQDNDRASSARRRMARLVVAGKERRTRTGEPAKKR
ncbi:MAG TPA: EcsC family protein [Thermoanaerobaculia bacterium]|nr:EcsC family protein [Thermoanaerobaculia bacterium]